MNKIYNGEYKITSPFGPRNLNGDTRPHKGEDHVGITNKMVVTPTNGKVISSILITDKSNPTWEWGNYIKIDDLNGFYLFFCHLDKRMVNVGEVIKEGQTIGIEGQTGYSFGSHCHFEVRRKSDNVSIDPREYFKILVDWEEKNKKLTVTKATEIVQNKAGLGDATINYLLKYQYGADLMIKLADSMK